MHSRILNFALLGALICNFSYSLAKLLAFSDDVNQLKFPGVWFNVIWNIFAFLYLYGIYYFCLLKEKRFNFLLIFIKSTNFRPDEQNIIINGEPISNAYQPLLNGSSSSTSQTSIISPEQEKLKISTCAHIRCLLHYCWHFWAWLAVGFIFLIIYSIGKSDKINYFIII